MNAALNPTVAVPAVTSDAETRNRYFDRLFTNPELMWLGQNTNHFPLHPAVRKALHDAIDDESFHAYAPPLGMETLRTAIVDDLGVPGQSAVVTDGAVAALALACRAFCEEGKGFVTTDPGWKWPLQFAAKAGCAITEIPIYGPEYGFKLSAEALAASTDADTAVIYLVDPNNPLGTTYTEEEIRAFADRAREIGAILIHDCTYRDFADTHTLASRFYPEGTVTIVSFSKWLGLAGLRLGALVASPQLLARILPHSQAPLGASVLAQRAAIAGLGVKAEWMAEVIAQQRENQRMIIDAFNALPGFLVPVFPSQANFIVVECTGAGVTPEALVTALGERDIMVRQGTYHTPRFGHRFIKISTTVPKAWAQALCDALPQAVERARTLPATAALF
ncbi:MULTISPECIES: pyridoxal phosphate-dependent aminotransferase [Variovorax]|jgi:histidinol-phosphate aminotransferase|uniref:pyridoxal phosphate-dependent aminotransferase n=1 Tax=Variovorax TaxID=34072 RepID=UPI000868CC9C|nr:MULTISPECIES: pyridoxal phosphate-dependent aminotransferase [Variovorax]MBN8758624.1 pyridoxal phosphate-dependent aminotransferase [Variovorax sp.]ODU11659.1 MAG: aspartate aminotransferase [Variovorax sp. SCN 67-85]ODV14976.1 MAG: aspartate aminotransferase [Variovorax sp. SCN 67-20]OJZ05305.1 MAG: aspartate aminotransferase [Variovorax sp. 67-131]UKI05254.1 pyridoxal phosphate-dependent aminotransferase [Variovorax paradoxus]